MKPFVAERISQTSTFPLRGTARDVFDLFTPLAEKEWADGWNPRMIFPPSGEAGLHLVFTTPGKTPEEGRYTWIVTQYDLEALFIEYTVFTNLRIWTVSVSCHELSAESAEVRVTYTYTGTTQRGNELNRQAMDEMFAEDLRDWQESINYYAVRRQLDSSINEPQK